ncbi:hypothetical protein N7478_011997 [Penicillium angulare]|uniref:uncharacterized protein n=1 Tax=Penicillium angulare TaxID=116970 RepID=UPI002541F529|nr:uncharacterized protein N7478_011997 [Penicillium angulare]KAJ5261402.1 hypothetical protein N7478_011997 [Penicillium angulare]
MPTIRSLAVSAILALLECANAQDTVGFGPAFSLGPVSSSSWIREAVTTLELPKVPSPVADRLALWPGMGTSGGDLVQALAVSFSDPNANCGATAGQWCTWASTLTDEQLGGIQVPASAGDQLTMHYKYNDSTGKYDQTVAINDSIISSLSTKVGEAQGWGTAVECQDSACKSSVPAHKYLSTKIILDSADESFGDTLVLTDATSSGLTTSDGGITWVVTTINIDAHTFDV